MRRLPGNPSTGSSPQGGVYGFISMKKEIATFDFHDRFISPDFSFSLLKNIDNKICLRYNSKKRDTKEDWACPLA
jgi:hypothetical protein